MGYTLGCYGSAPLRGSSKGPERDLLGKYSPTRRYQAPEADAKERGVKI